MTLDTVTQNSSEAIRKGSKSFASAARLFKKDTRHDVYMLYAWCRHCDDEIDGQEFGFAVAADRPRSDEARLALIRRLTQRALAGEEMEDPAFQGLQRVVDKYAIPARYPLELIEGFAMDVSGRSYETLEDTLLYCYHVAGVVGVMMANIMGIRDAPTLSRAADLGIAFQLTNIARDVMDDARAGRIYLPREWLRKAGVRPDAMLTESSRPGIASVVSDLLGVADRYYASAHHGIPALPARAAWAVSTAGGVYRDIGRIVLSRGPDAWNRRAIVSKPRKLYWVITGAMRTLAAKSWGRRRPELPRAPDLWIKADLC